MKILFAALSYMLGSVPTGFLIVKAADRKDIRAVGSRSTGATNVLRLKGWRFAVPVAVIDILKGFLPAFLAVRIFEDAGLAALCAFLAVLGHCFPFSIGFKGGKGVATSVGAYASLALKPLLLSLAVFLLVLAAGRFVSLASIAASLAFPLFVLVFGGPDGVFFWSLAISLLIVFNHRANIRRLLNGTERQFGERLP